MGSLLHPALGSVPNSSLSVLALWVRAELPRASYFHAELQSRGPQLRPCGLVLAARVVCAVMRTCGLWNQAWGLDSSHPADWLCDPGEILKLCLSFFICKVGDPTTIPL